MADGRMLKRAISDSKKLSELKTDSARLLWTWILPYLDIEGRYFADPDMIKGKVVPRLKTFTPENISEYLSDMNNIGLITLYESDGEKYLQFRNFKEFQNLRESKEAKSKIPSPKQIPDKGGSSTGVIPHNLIKENLIKEKLREVPEQSRTVDNSTQKEPPFEDETLQKELNDNYWKILKLYPKFKIQKFFQIYKDKNPKAIIHTFNRLIEQTGKTGEVQAPWAYCEKIITQENMNYNEQDHITKAAEFKKPIDLVQWAQNMKAV